MVLLVILDYSSSHTVTTQTSYITHIVVGDAMYTKGDENKCAGTVSDGDDWHRGGDNQIKRQPP